MFNVKHKRNAAFSWSMEWYINKKSYALSNFMSEILKFDNKYVLTKRWVWFEKVVGRVLKALMSFNSKVILYCVIITNCYEEDIINHKITLPRQPPPQLHMGPTYDKSQGEGMFQTLGPNLSVSAHVGIKVIIVPTVTVYVLLCTIHFGIRF